MIGYKWKIWPRITLAFGVHPNQMLSPFKVSWIDWTFFTTYFVRSTDFVTKKHRLFIFKQEAQNESKLLQRQRVRLCTRTRSHSHTWASVRFHPPSGELVTQSCGKPGVDFGNNCLPNLCKYLAWCLVCIEWSIYVGWINESIKKKKKVRKRQTKTDLITYGKKAYKFREPSHSRRT